MGNAMRIADATVMPQTYVAASRLPATDKEVASAFRGEVIQFSAAELAQAAARTKSAAKGWKATDDCRAPSLASIINMARSLPRVREWLMAQIGFDHSAQSGSVDSIVRALYAVAMGDGNEAAIAHDMIEKLRHPLPELRNDAVILYLAQTRRT